jgi:hypothetical protein
MTAAVTTYTVAAILIVALLVMTALTVAVYRLILTHTDNDDDDTITVPDPVTGTVWDQTVAAIGHPDDIDTTMAMPPWPADEAEVAQ